jgi:hypothetical protein
MGYVLTLQPKNIRPWQKYYVTNIQTKKEEGILSLQLIQSNFSKRNIQFSNLLIFADLENPSPNDRDKGLIIAENSVVLQMDKFNIIEGLTVLIGCYYIFHLSYPKSSVAGGFLLFVQEILLEMVA